MNNQESGGKGVSQKVTAQALCGQNPAGSQLVQDVGVNVYQSKIKQSEPKVFTGIDSLAALFMLVCGFLFIHMETFFVGWRWKGMGTTISAMVFIGASLVYMNKSGFRQTKESLLYLGLITVAAARCALIDGGWVENYSVLLLMVLAVYWIAATTGRRLKDQISALSAADLLNQFILVPFSNFTCCFSGIGSGLGKTKKGKRIAGGFLGLLIFAPVLVVVTGLLVSADAAFEIWVESFLDSFFENMFLHVVEMIIALPVACYLFGLLYGNVKGRYTGRITEESVLANARAVQIAPSSAIYACLAALCMIYMIFFAAQASYLFSAFDNQLHGALTYSEYARRGFFELCKVAAINLAVIGAACLLLRRSEEDRQIPRPLKGFTILLSAQTLVLLITAMRKMVMYISYYGLTQPRVYTTWFMAVLFVLFALLILRQIKVFQLPKAAVLFTVVAFLALSYSNVEGQIARYNIEGYQAGRLEDLSLYGETGLSSLSDGAVPHIVKLYETTEDAQLKEELKDVLKLYKYRSDLRGIDRGRVKYWNLQSAAAYSQIEKALMPTEDEV